MKLANVEESFIMGVELHFSIPSCLHAEGSSLLTLLSKCPLKAGDLSSWCMWEKAQLFPLWVCSSTASSHSDLLLHPAAPQVLVPMRRPKVFSAVRDLHRQTYPAQVKSGSKLCFLIDLDPHSPLSLYQ